MAAAPVPDVPLDVKIGRMIIAGFRGTVVDSDDAFLRYLVDCHVGGIILYDRDVATGVERNIASPEQVTELVAELKDAAVPNLIVTIDQEGGLVNRLPPEKGFPESLSARELGQRNDPDFTYEQARDTAKTLHSLGINLNLAPVVDLDINPENPIIAGKERSFSLAAKTVTKHAAAVVEAHRSQGVLSCLKHFPGHGSSRTDSHLGLTDVTDTWKDGEVLPYRDLITSGHADSIMISHVFHRNLDPVYPATLSRNIIETMLREDLAYDGVVISDDLQMGAITNHFGLETALGHAINAGTDLITLGNNVVFEEDLIPRAHGMIKDMVLSGKISEARIDSAYKRIQVLAV